MIVCEHCKAPITLEREDPSGAKRWLIKGHVAVKDGELETNCPSCKCATRLPVRFVVQPEVQTPRFVVRRRAP